MDPAAAWVVGAVGETAQPGTPWSLLEVEYLEHFAEKLAKEHPKLCGAAPGEKPAAELLEPVCEAARCILSAAAAATCRACCAGCAPFGAGFGCLAVP